MDFVTPLIAPLIRAVVGCLPFSSILDHIRNCETNRNDLETQFKDLSVVRSNVEAKIEEARNNGLLITSDVKTWLEEVQITETEVSEWLSITNDMSTTCGPLPNCYKCYKISTEAQRKTKDILSFITRGGHLLAGVSHPVSAVGIGLVPHGDFTPFDSITISLNATLRALARFSKVGVVGAGGIGKTTMVLEVGRVVKEQFDQVVFVVVSQAVNIRRIQGELGDQLGLKLCKESENGRAYEIRNRIKVENRILIILDDVWDKIELFDIGIPFGDEHNGCKILITTRREQVCSSMELQETIKLDFLNENEAWQLFSNNVGGKLNDPSPELKMVAKDVIKECGGLPLALVVVAQALRREDVEEWKFAVDRLQESELPDIDTVDRNVYSCLKLSYDYLKVEDTKKCFLLCSLFPEDYEIVIEELAKYAFGFGLFAGANSFQQLKQRVRRTIKELKGSSLLLNSKDIDHVKIHDVVRDVALWITSKGNHDSDEVFLVPIPSHKNWTRDPKLTKSTAISLLSCPEKELFPRQAYCPRLKMLLLAQKKPLPNLVDSCFKGMTALQVLDITATKAKPPPDLVLPSSIKLLSNLRVLYLRGWTLKGDMSMIGALKKLEILSFRKSVLEQVPKEILELTSLIIMDFTACRVQESYDDIIPTLFRQVQEFYTPRRSDSDEE